MKSRPHPRAPHRMMSMNVPPIILCAMVAAAFASLSAAQETGLPEGWVSFDDVTQTPTSPAIKIVSSNLSELVLTVTTPGVVSAAVSEDDVEYRKLEFPGYYRSKVVGHPLLPAVRQLIAVPEGCEVEVSVSPGEAVHYRGSVLYPVPATVVRYTAEGWEYLAEEFAIDEDAYSQSGHYPSEIASVSEGGSLRGQGVALLTVYPAQYDAAEMDLRVFPSLVVTLRFVGGKRGLAEPLGPLGRIADAVLMNYQASGDPIRLESGPGQYELCQNVAECEALGADYLMIVESSVMDSAWTLADHRATWNGWNVAVVPDTAIAAVMDTTVIRSFIREVYESESAEHMDDGRLGYVLLVGDAREGEPDSLLPAREEPVGDTIRPYVTTDHWYACVDGDDEYADLMIGRVSTDTGTELGREARKVKRYESSASSSDPWRTDVLLSNGFTWGSVGDCYSGDDSKFASTEAAFVKATQIMGASADSILRIRAHDQLAVSCEGRREATRPLNVRQINADRQFVELCAHGWEWGVHTFHSEMPPSNPVDDVLSLSNADSLPFSLPFWMVYSCSSGAYDAVDVEHGRTDCLGERLMHGNGMNGAVGYFGASELSGNAWEYLGTYMWEAFFEQHLHTLGDAIAYAKLKDFSVTANRSEVLMFNLLGDPALNVFMTDVGYGDRPDYVVDPCDLRTSPAFPPASGTGYLEAVVHNRSNCDPDSAVAVVFTLCERDGSGCAVLDTVMVQPNAWSADTARVAWNAGSQDEAGHRILKVRVDPEDEQEELIEDNNEAENHIGSYFTERSGFPVPVGGLVGFSPIVTEIDNNTADGLEVVVATRDSGRVGVHSCADGDSLWGFTVPDGQTVRGSPAVGDLDGDGSLEVVVCYGDSVKAYRASGSPFWGHYAEGLDSGPVFGDFIGGDGRLETVVTRGSGEEEEAQLSALFIAYDGNPLREQIFSSSWWKRSANSLEPCPTAAHLDGDGRVDMVASYERSIIGSCAGLVAADGDGGSWSKKLALGGGDVGNVHPCNPVVGEIDAGSAGLEVLAGARTLDWVGTMASSPTLLRSRTLHGYLAGVSLADLDSDGDLEIAAATYGAPEDPDSIAGRVYVFEANGDPELVVSSSRPCFMPPYGNRELSHLDILTLTGGQLERFIERPLFFWGRLMSTPTIKDTNDDGYLEIWLVDGEGYLHCLEYQDAGLASRWACFQHDERHTGSYETPVTGAYPSSTAASWWGDYLMTGDVTVDATSSLLVQPGATVRAALEDDQESGADPDFVELIVRGELLAGGDTLRPAAFTSAAESPTEEDCSASA
jgi:hypothetical protein